MAAAQNNTNNNNNPSRSTTQGQQQRNDEMNLNLNRSLLNAQQYTTPVWSRVYNSSQMNHGGYFETASFGYSSMVEQSQFQREQFFAYQQQQQQSYEWTEYRRSWPPPAPPRRRLPATRSWELTEFGRVWYEKQQQKQQQPRKFRKTNTTTIVDSTVANDEFKFKLATYNLLAPNLLDDNSYLYDRIPAEFLDWERRKTRILEQIEREHADIWCFQEMDENQYFQYFLPKLTNLGFTSFFKKRLGQKRDGCVVCFNERKFELVKLDQVEFNVVDVEILNRENVGLILLLKAKRTNNNSSKSGSQKEKYLCVANTHLLYNPKRGDCKLAQIQLFLAHLDRIACRECVQQQQGSVRTLYHPIVLCGDLNLTSESLLYEFLSRGKLSNYTKMNSYFLSGQLIESSQQQPLVRLIDAPILPERLGITDQSQFKEDVDNRCSNKSNYSFGSDDLTHSFRFRSVYAHRNQHGKSEVTTCTGWTKRTVDYIFIHSDDNYDDHQDIETNSTPTTSNSSQQPQRKRLSSDCKSDTKTTTATSLKLIARLKLFTNDLVPDHSIPDHNYPSDHFILAAKLLLV